MRILFSFVAMAILSCTAFSQVIYDINFQSADQAVNQIVTTGPPPDHVSEIWFGKPTVVAAFGPLTDQPLLFNSNGQTPLAFGLYYTQIELTFASVPMSSVDLSFDMVDSGSGHTFTVLFDTPTVRNFEFSNGQVLFLNPYFPDAPVGNYPMGQAFHFDIHIDYLLNQWSLTENSMLLGTGAFDPDGNLRSIRFNYSAAGPDISGTAIDNLRVIVVPEPSTWSIMASVCFLLAGRHFCPRRV